MSKCVAMAMGRVLAQFQSAMLGILPDESVYLCQSQEGWGWLVGASEKRALPFPFHNSMSSSLLYRCMAYGMVWYGTSIVQ